MKTGPVYLPVRAVMVMLGSAVMWATGSTSAVAQEAPPYFNPNWSGGEGEVTVVLAGESETLPIWGGTWDPAYRDDPEFGASGLVRFHIIASPATEPDRWRGDHVSEIVVVFNEETLEIARGENRVEDHRATPPEVENYMAASDMAADSDLQFTIEEYEVREGSGFVRGRLLGTASEGRSLSGTFLALVPPGP